MSTPTQKQILRKKFLTISQELPSLRRDEAAQKLSYFLLPLLDNYTHILSFASLPNEIDTSLLNKILAEQGRLLLPKLSGTELKVFAVTNLEKQLQQGSFNIMEPITSQCEEISPQKINIALVPGVGFDSQHNRLGRGKGFYDKFLSKNNQIISWGICFQEQLAKQTLPTTKNDIALTKVFFF